MGRTRLLAGPVVMALALVLVSCTGDGELATGTASTAGASSRGGTLRIAIGTRSVEELDPTTYVGGMAFELFRCCLVRTLFSYNGRPAAEGGSVLRPDLAAEMPDVSSDGLTWTFRLKEGLRYAPPFQDREIVAADIVRALERQANPKVNPPGLEGIESYVFYYSIIQGLDAFWAGKAETITGLETPDDHTLIVRLSEPAGDLPDRFSLAATAPIPEGAAMGHPTDYFRYLVGSGPYMIEGSEDLDPSVSPKDQVPVSGFDPRTSLTLVRNPSWSSATDDLRPAYADRIEISMTRETHRTVDELARHIDRGLLDLSLVGNPTALLARYLEDPTLRDRVHVDASNVGVFVEINLALPPFDDIHVRRAVALVVDRKAVARLHDEEVTTQGTTFPTWHIAPDGVEAALLSDWQPSWAEGVGSRGSLAAARVEMARSRYDGNGDGRCDARPCSGVPLVVNPTHEVQSEIARALKRIGITFDITVVPVAASGRTYGAPASRVVRLHPLIGGWLADYPNASTFFVPLFTGASISERWTLNLSLLGATPEQLDAWGYRVGAVPTADNRIARCLGITGQVQTTCWARLDQYLMQEVVPVIPLGEVRYTYVVSERVTGYSFSQWNIKPAFDRIALAPDAT